MEIQIGMDAVLAMGDNEEAYKKFTEKFTPKKTTDDCYTPDNIYRTVADWVCQEYGIRTEDMVRPFWPGADFEQWDYMDDSVVVDNPPFSILSKILHWYIEHGIRFFLFAPSLTLFSGRNLDVTYIPTGNDVTYENGAAVKTSFVTNLDTCRVRTAPDLYRAIDKVNRDNQKAGKVELPKYEYPDYVITAAAMQRLTRYGIDLRIGKESCAQISAMDAQRACGKSIFGSGFILSERAAAERAAAERAAAERAAAIRWEISGHEKQIIAELNRMEQEAGEV